MLPVQFVTFENCRLVAREHISHGPAAPVFPVPSGRLQGRGRSGQPSWP